MRKNTIPLGAAVGLLAANVACFGPSEEELAQLVVGNWSLETRAGVAFPYTETVDGYYYTCTDTTVKSMEVSGSFNGNYVATTTSDCSDDYSYTYTDRYGLSVTQIEGRSFEIAQTTDSDGMLIMSCDLSEEDASLSCSHNAPDEGVVTTSWSRI